VLNVKSQPNTEFVFQIGVCLPLRMVRQSTSKNGNSTDGVYFVLGSSATCGTGTDFAGNVLADQHATLTARATILCGRAIALVGKVTMGNNTISNDCIGYNAGAGGGDPSRYGLSNGGTPPTVGATPTLFVPKSASLLLLIAGLAGIPALRRPGARQSGQ